MAATSELRREVPAKEQVPVKQVPVEPMPVEDPAEKLRNLRDALPASLRSRLESGRDLARRRRESPAPRPRPSGTPELDRLLEGGLPAGRLVEVVGRRSDGRFSTVLTALAAATSRGEAAALVDLGDALDPRGAQRAGVVLARLLWVRPRTVQEALLATEHLLTGGFPLVALDLGQPPIPGGRGTEAAWLRLSRAAAAQGRHPPGHHPLARHGHLRRRRPGRPPSVAPSGPVAAGSPGCWGGLEGGMAGDEGTGGRRGRPADDVGTRRTGKGVGPAGR